MTLSPANRDHDAAVRYVQRYFLPSSALLGMVGMIGVFLLSTVEWQRHTLTVMAFTREMTIGLMGALLSLLHARYQYFLFENFPGHYREMLEKADRFALERPSAVNHPKRQLVMGGYVAGILLYAGAIWLLHGGVSWIGIVSFAMSGFFITRVAFWKRVVDAEAGGKGGA
jgi:hypothetical protein